MDTRVQFKEQKPQRMHSIIGRHPCRSRTGTVILAASTMKLKLTLVLRPATTSRKGLRAPALAASTSITQLRGAFRSKAVVMLRRFSQSDKTTLDAPLRNGITIKNLRGSTPSSVTTYIRSLAISLSEVVKFSINSIW